MRYRDEMPDDWTEAFESSFFEKGYQYDERDWDIHERTRDYLYEVAESHDLEAADTEMYVGVTPHCWGETHPLFGTEENVNAVCFARRDRSKLAYPGVYGIKVNRGVLEFIGWEAYKPILRHELAHVEAIHAYSCTKESKGKHKEMCRLLDAPLNGEETREVFVSHLGTDGYAKFQRVLKER